MDLHIQDEKILGLITQRGESEIIQRKQRMKHALAWNQEKLDSDKLKLEKDKHHRANIDLTREEDRQKVVVKKVGYNCHCSNNRNLA